MAAGTVSVEFQQAAFDRAMREFVSDRLPEAVDAIVRNIAFGVTHQTMLAMNGVDGLPKRIDTGRLRGAWRAGLKSAGVKTTGLPAGSGAVQPGDGTGTLKSSAKGTTVVVSNNVEYARYVEDGTSRMRGGHHLKRALILARRDLPTDTGPGSAQDEIRAAFEGS